MSCLHVPFRALVRNVVSVLAIGGAVAASAAAQELETFVMTVGGQATCGTFMSPAAVTAFFGNYGPSLPVGGLGPCNVAGDLRSATSVAAPLSDNMSLSATWNVPASSLTAHATSTVNYGALAAGANVDFVFGSGSGGTSVIGAESFAIASDGLTFTSPSVANGQAGWMRATFAVTGMVSTTGNGTSEAFLNYKVNAGFSTQAFRAYAFGLGSPFLTAGGGGDLSQFTLTPGAAIGSGVARTYWEPIVFGASTTFKCGLLTHDTTGVTTLTQRSNFQATIAGFELLNASGQPLSNFTIVSASGVNYDAGGVGPVPVLYCAPKLSSAGCTNSISTSSTSAPISGANDYYVTCSNVQGSKSGRLFAGAAGPAAAPFSGGLLCVTPPFKRGPIVFSGPSNPAACGGSFSTLVNTGSILPLGLDAGPGNSSWCQYWYRDPLNGAGNLGTALSNAVRLDFQ